MVTEFTVSNRKKRRLEHVSHKDKWSDETKLEKA